MPEPEPALPDKSYIQSLTLKGAAAMALAFVAGELGFDPGDPALLGLSDSLVDLVFYAGLLAVGVGRARARGPLA